MSHIDHVGISVRDFDKSIAFYKEALGALGIKCLTEFEHEGKRHAGFGTGDKAFFWLSSGNRTRGELHIAFTAKSRSEVHAFYSIALSVGGRDNGKPGLRPHYHANYYGAFVHDPDGHNIEAVCHGPE